jgi:predicted RNase H-like HicB family nuclease
MRRTIVMEIPLKVVIHRAKQGGYWAEVPALPGCLTEAETLEELDVMIRDAIDGWIDAGNDRPAEPDEDDAGPVQVMVL